MPFIKGDKRAGRPKGSRNKPKLVNEYLCDAFDRVLRESDYNAMAKAALEEFLGKPVTVTDAFGKEKTETRRDDSLMRTVLQYVARRMPLAVETTVHPLDTMTPEAIEKKWSRCQSLKAARAKKKS
jgi:hypothetical protein